MVTSARHESDDTLRTIDHDEVRQWVEARDGRPSVVESTHGEGEGGILRIDFGTKEESLEEISWKEFFRIFEESELAFLYQEHTKEGEPSFFCKFVSREPEDEEEQENSVDEDTGETDEDADDELEDDFDREEE